MNKFPKTNVPRTNYTTFYVNTLLQYFRRLPYTRQKRAIMNRAPFAYFGGKYRLLDHLQNYIPPLRSIDCYVEPFFGSGTLFFSRERLGQVEVINDYSSYIYNFFRVLRDKNEALIKRLKYTPYSKETFLEARAYLANGKNAVTKSHLNIPTREQVYAAWCVYLIYSMSIFSNGRNFSRGKDKSKAIEFKENQARLDYCVGRLQNATIENEDALDTVKRYDSPRTFVYLDPPYLNVKNPISMKKAYHGNDGNELHERLLDWCLSARSMIMISNYQNDLYDEKLKNWNREEISVKLMTLSGRNKPGLVRDSTEIIWTSPNVPVKKQMDLFNG